MIRSLSSTCTCNAPVTRSCGSLTVSRIRHSPADDTDRHEPVGAREALRERGARLLRVRVRSTRGRTDSVDGRCAETNADMWATVEESRDDIVSLYRRAWAHADATIAALPLDVTGEVPWWPEQRRYPTLHRVLIHVIAEVQRHAGHPTSRGTDRRCRRPAPERQQPSRPRPGRVGRLPREAGTRCSGSQTRVEPGGAKNSSVMPSGSRSLTPEP